MKKILVLGAVLSATIAIACSDDGPIAAGGGSSSSSSSSGGSGSSSGGNQEGGAPGDVPFPERLCEALPQAGGEIEEQGAWGAPPPPIGGTVTAGTYVLTELFAYGGAPPDPPPGEEIPASPPSSGKAAKVTLYISGNTMRFQEARGDLNALPAAESTRGLSFAPGATSFETQSQCPSAGTAASLGYTAVGATIAINVDATHREIYKRSAQ